MTHTFVRLKEASRQRGGRQWRRMKIPVGRGGGRTG